MPFVFKKPKLLGKAKRSPGNKKLLQLLNQYIDDNLDEPVRVLAWLWEDQSTVITYAEIREMIETGDVTEEQLEQWRQDYSKVITEKFVPLWENAINTGQLNEPFLDAARRKGFDFDLTGDGIRQWVETRSANLITSVVDEQRKAIKYMTARSLIENMDPDELAKVIRPCIGLTARQAEANVKYYRKIKTQMKKEHPRTSEETIARRARNKALKYSEKQHRDRAETIAQTEIADAYNNGAHIAIKQAQEHDFIGKVKKVWVTARYGNVCQHCQAMEGIEADLDEFFDVPYFGSKLVPTAHPRCRCVVKYIEVKEEVTT